MLFCEVDVHKGVKIVSEVGGIVWVELMSLIGQVEVLNVAFKGSEQSQIVLWPLFLHVLVDFSSVESVPVMI